MNMDEAVELIECRGRFGRNPDHRFMLELLRTLGDPQKRLKYIHVAGTNGKGSCSKMISSVLTAAGYHVGLFTSPHLVSYTERIQLDGTPVSEKEFCALADEVCGAAAALDERYPDDGITIFELLTVMGLLYFSRHCDIAVLEVGMGGRLDATNIIDMPEVAVIMNIGLEHTEYLGNTIAQIAFEKAGIIKPGCDVAAYDSGSEATAVLKEVCKQRDAVLHIADFKLICPISQGVSGQRFDFDGMSDIFIPLLGEHQRRNTAVALLALKLLKAHGWNVTDEAVRAGLTRAHWPARMEVLCRSPLFIVDGAHNPQCAQALASGISEAFKDEKFTFLVGVLADKNYADMMRPLVPHARRFVCMSPASPRALPPEKLAETLTKLGAAETVVAKSLNDALDTTLGYTDCGAVACGSLYLAGAVRAEFLRRSARQ